MLNVFRPHLSRNVLLSTSVATLTSATLFLNLNNQQQPQRHYGASTTFCDDGDGNMDDPNDEASSTDYLEEKIVQNARLQKMLPQIIDKLKGCKTAKEATERVQLLLKERHMEFYEKHPCGPLLEKWHDCIHRRMAEKSEDYFLDCAEPEMLDFRSCISDQKERIKQVLIKHWGKDGFDKYVSEQQDQINKLVQKEKGSSIDISSNSKVSIEELRQRFRNIQENAAAEREGKHFSQEGQQEQQNQKGEEEIKKRSGWRRWFGRG